MTSSPQNTADVLDPGIQSGATAPALQGLAGLRALPNCAQRPGVRWSSTALDRGAGIATEETLIVPCDLAKVDTHRTHWPFLRDRRIDAYHDLTKRLLI